MTTVKNDWFRASVYEHDSYNTFDISNMNYQTVCTGIAKWDGCMDFEVHIGHFCDGKQIIAFAEILCAVRSIATRQQQ